MDSEKEVGSVLFIVEETVTASVNAPNLKTGFPPGANIIPIAAIPAIKSASDLQNEHRLQSAVPASDNHVAAVTHQPSKKSCKHCSSANIERKRRVGWEKIVLPVIKTYRYICYSCGGDFYAKRSV